MARKSQFERLVGNLIHLPWWVSPVVGGVFFVGLRFVVPKLLGESVIASGVVGLAQGAAPWFFVFFCVVGLLSFLNCRRKSKPLERHTDETSFSGLTWKEFEELVGEVYRRKGYRVTENYTAGPDGGVDLRIRKDGERIIVQCKRWNRWKVGVKVVRELKGIMAAEAADKGVVVISSDFTEEARRFARENDIELVDGRRLSGFIKELQREKASLAEPEKVLEFHPEKDVPDDPKCPLCGKAMVLRTAKQGKYAGQQFYGCSGYPNCRGVRKIPFAA